MKFANYYALIDTTMIYFQRSYFFDVSKIEELNKIQGKNYWEFSEKIQ